MNKYYSHVWNPDDTMERFIDLILADPDGFHFYDGSTEFEVGRWYNSGRINQWLGIHQVNDPLTAKYLKLLELYEQRPDVKSRVVSNWGHHSMVDSINFPRPNEEIYSIFGKTYNSYLLFLLRILGINEDYDPGTTPHETNASRQYGFPTIEKSLRIKPTQLFNFPMNRPHPQRVNAFHAMIELDLLDRGYLGFCADNEAWHNFVQLAFDSLHRDQNPSAREYFEPIFKNIDTVFKKAVSLGEVDPSGNWSESDAKIPPPGYNDQTYSSFHSVFDIVSESTGSYVHFFTEKTFKSVLWGKPFVILGTPNQNKVFADMGFEPYSDFFDLSGTEDYFQGGDNDMLSNRGQVDAYKKVLKPLTQIDPAEYCKIKAQAMPTVKHNHNVMVKKVFSDDIIPWEILSDPKAEYETSNHLRPQFVLQLRECLKQHTYFKQFLP